MAPSHLRALLLVSGLACALLVAPARASAHGNVMESMDPADGSTVTAPIEQVELEYAQPPGIERVEVVAPGGAATSVRARAQGTRVVVPFTPDAAGRWSLRWKVVQSDGHAIGYERTLVVAPSAIPRTAADDVRDELAALWDRVLARLVAFT